MKISACMIVKNEEKNLSRAIESLTFADELILVDTGSTDGTKELAGQFTNHLYEFNMRGDFSAARNFAFSKCSMDYIYTADADEVIDSSNQAKISDLKNSLSESTDIVQMLYSNQLQFSSIYNFNSEYRPKLFKRLRTFRWVDPVHEIIDMDVHILNSDIIILHMPNELHAGRDFSIFERIARPGALISPRLHRLYAQELFLSGTEHDFLNAYPYFEWTLHEKDISNDGIRQSQCVVVRCCALRKDSEGMFKIALKNTIGRPSAEVCCELGNYYKNKKDFEEAATWYYTAAFGAECELSARCSGNIPLKGLSESYRMLGDVKKSEKYRKMANEWQFPDVQMPYYHAIKCDGANNGICQN